MHPKHTRIVEPAKPTTTGTMRYPVQASNGSQATTTLSADAGLGPESDHKDEGPVEEQPIMAGTMIINRTPTAAGGGSLIGADRHHRRVYMQGVGRLHGTMHASNAGCTGRRGPDVAADHWTGSWWHRCAASSAWFSRF